MEKFCLLKKVCTIFVVCAATAITSHAQTFTTLLEFDGTNGATPAAGVVQATDGNFYGTTELGGTSDNCEKSSTGITGCGTFYKITSAGSLTTLFSFDGTDGAGPWGLVQASNGDFYGVTGGGGTSGNCQAIGVTGCGTVFKITSSGKLTTLHNFDLTDGAVPLFEPTQGTDGNLCGVTGGGGTGSNCPSSQFSYGCGTVFKITTAGKLTTLHNFCSQANCADGAEPDGLVEGTDGNFYGTTYSGGGSANCTDGCGTVFKISPSGTLTTLHGFDFTQGAYPGNLALASDGNFYGTAGGGGANSLPDCTHKGVESGCGTMFRITPAGSLTTLYNFCSQTNCADGGNPGGPIQGTDGNFYGGTDNYGEYGYGTIFKMVVNRTSGTLTTEHNFDFTDGGAAPGGMQATNGTFYGTSDSGGNTSCSSDGCGTIWTLSVGLGPFVQARLTMGKVGATIILLGDDLTGSTAVSFDGVAATTFKVVSSTEMTATVPTGALTGRLTVTTPSGTLNSSGPFYVTPQLTTFSPTSGPVGTSVAITGVSLTQTTTVTFGGVKASFTVVNDTTVTATVPTGAVTGKINVRTKGGTATSATSFTVTE